MAKMGQSHGQIEASELQCYLWIVGDVKMRVEIEVDDALLADAREYTGIDEIPTLMRIALQSLVQREAARRLARLGGSAPDLVAPPRRRLDPVEPE
jgi:Arc/MetJ family transcription regulator